jgi:hypothetical protein
MRFPVAAVLITVVALFSLPAAAGNVTFVNGQAVWQSTLCPAPATPPSLANVNPEMRAEELNSLISQYNQYVQATQNYMNCISAEAQHDGETANEAIVHSGQAMIADVQKNVTVLGATLQVGKQQ